MMYIRYQLSLRQIEDLLFERGIDQPITPRLTRAIRERPGTRPARCPCRRQGRRLDLRKGRVERLAIGPGSGHVSGLLARCA
jgi:hypothetical protein